MDSLREWFCGYIAYFKSAGFMGVLVELLHIESSYHDMYKHAFKEGMRENFDLVQRIVRHLEAQEPTIEPFRHRRACQIAGFKAALKVRGDCVMPNVRVEAGPAAKPQARTMENSASPLCGPGVLMLGLASNEGLGLRH